MKLIDRYLISNILKIAFFTVIVFSFLLAAVELFSKMDQIMNNDLPVVKIINFILLSIPEYLMLVSSISLLFATTYFLSTLSANNERIALLNAGLSKWRLACPIIIVSILLTIAGYCYQDAYLNKIIAKHDELEVELFGMSSTRDTRNIALKDDNGFAIYTTRFDEIGQKIYNPIVIKYNDDALFMKLQAEYGEYSSGYWTFYNANVNQIVNDNVLSSFKDIYSIEELKIEPNLFKSQNTRVETMDSVDARKYLARLKIADHAAWQEKATDYYRSRFQCLAIFVLMSISAMLDYRFKKNVLLFSIIQSLSIAVAYYCADMVFSIMAHQGAIAPYQTVVLPLAVTIIIAYTLSLVGKKL